jgi:hypothetical protein
MEIPFIGPTMSSAVDAIGNGKPSNIGFFQVSAAGVTGAAVGTTSAPALFNPPGSGKLVRILRVTYADESGTIIRAHIRRYWQPNPILSGLTEGAVQARNGVVSVCKWYTALTVAAAATQWMPAGIGSGGAVAAQFYWMQDFIEGIETINPNEIWWPYVSNAALAMVASIGVTWLETPIPTGN